METSFTHTKVPGVKYIAGVTFQSEYGTHEAGSEVKEAEKFANLQVLVDSHFLYPYAPEEGYAWLPPHLFTAVRTRQEVLDAMAGDPTGPHIKFEKTDLHEQAEKNAEQQEVIYEKLRATEQPGAPAEPGPTPEEVASRAIGDQTKTTRRRRTNKEKNNG